MLDLLINLLLELTPDFFFFRPAWTARQTLPAKPKPSGVFMASYEVEEVDGGDVAADPEWD